MDKKEQILKKIRLVREQLDRAESELNDRTRNEKDSFAQAASWINEAESYCSEAYEICHRSY